MGVKKLKPLKAQDPCSNSDGTRDKSRIYSTSHCSFPKELLSRLLLTLAFLNPGSISQLLPHKDCEGHLAQLSAPSSWIYLQGATLSSSPFSPHIAGPFFSLSFVGTYFSLQTSCRSAGTRSSILFSIYTHFLGDSNQFHEF